MKTNKKKETVKDIIFQIWNDGWHRRRFYSESDINSFRRRLKNTMKVKETNKRSESIYLDTRPPTEVN